VNLSGEVRINYVLDFESESTTESQSFIPRSHERIFNGEFGSPGGARNFALNYCDSEYVCFWDVDDLPNLVEIMNLLIGLKNSNKDLGIGNWSFHDSPIRLQGVSPFSVGISPGIWRFIFRRELVASTKFSLFKWGEDQLFLLEIFKKKPTVFTYLNSVYFYVRHTDGSLTTKTENVFDLIKVNEIGLKHLGLIHGRAKICFEIMHLKQIYSVIKYGQCRVGGRLLVKNILSFGRRNMNPVSLVYRIGKIRKWE
jgi:glycosyltransferase involved in cell wall biosynthesis